MKSYPHMCQDDHIEIGHADGGDDERCPLCRANDDIEYYRQALESIAAHKPGTPGLRYESIDQLLESAVGIARVTLDIPALVEQRRRELHDPVGQVKVP